MSRRAGCISKYSNQLKGLLHYAYRLPDNESESKQAPVPLLPNFSGICIRQYNLDPLLMEVLNGQERTLSGHTQLAEAAGVWFVKFWDLGEMGVVKFALA